MESDEDPLLVKFLISSLEFEKLKYYESKCKELTAELDNLKTQKLEQIGGGNYVVQPSAFDSLQTPVLKEVIEDKPLINYSVSITKNDDNDKFDDSALLHLVNENQQFNAKCLLNKIDDRGSELTWNSSGVVFIDKISIPNSNFFTIFPHLFLKTLPSKEITGMKEVIEKLKLMGLQHYICLKPFFPDVQDVNSAAADNIKGAGQETTPQIVEKDEGKKEYENNSL